MKPFPILLRGTLTISAPALRLQPTARKRRAARSRRELRARQKTGCTRTPRYSGRQSPHGTRAAPQRSFCGSQRPLPAPPRPGRRAGGGGAEGEGGGEGGRSPLPARLPARDPQPATAAGGPARRPQTLPAEFTLLEAGLVRRRRPRGFSLLLHRHRSAPAGGRPGAGARRLGPPGSALLPLLSGESGGESGPVSPRCCWSPPRWARPGLVGSGRAGPGRGPPPPPRRSEQ